jgi:SAM-dependent methyltransferase
LDRSVYERLATSEKTHWWYVGRRRMIATLLDDLDLTSDARLIELGAGTGGNLVLLGRYGSVRAMEYDDEARQFASSKTNVPVLPGRLPDQIPFEDESADVVGLFDVLEHVEDDAGSLRAIRKLLAPTGTLVMSVPAHQWLWSGHDVVLHHHRRYSKPHLRKLAEDSGYTVRRLTYFNSTLFPAAAMVRLLDRRQKNGDVAGSGHPPALINSFLAGVLKAEARIVGAVGGLPIGLSLFAVLSKAEL